ATGAPIARDAALAGLGAELALSRSAAIGLAYIGQYGGGNREHTGSLSLRWLFGA
ncbi:autotransporter outer membrane beta-barrel domain-containing protein, partial [Bordetella bronchiseptica]